MNKCSMESTDLCEVTQKLIWQQGAVFLENYLWFILLGESFYFPVKMSVGKNSTEIPLAKVHVPASDCLSSSADITVEHPGCTLCSPCTLHAR